MDIILQAIIGFVFYAMATTFIAGIKKYAELYASDLYEKRHA